MVRESGPSGLFDARGHRRRLPIVARNLTTRTRSSARAIPVATRACGPAPSSTKTISNGMPRARRPRLSRRAWPRCFPLRCRRVRSRTDRGRMSITLPFSQPVGCHRSVLCHESVGIGKVRQINKLRVAVVAACPFPYRWHADTASCDSQRRSPTTGTRFMSSPTNSDQAGSTNWNVTVCADIPSYRKTSPGPTFRKLVRV
jgi:hypothetical protein